MDLLKTTRPEVINNIKNTRRFDVVIVGGGIHGAMFARIAALNGLKTLLLELNDYASATSSRSSKMAHGGLRYLEMYDFIQVREGIRAREDLFITAPHLVKAHPFLFPISKNAWFTKVKMSLGLWFYDQLVKDKKHKWLDAVSLQAGSNNLNSSEYNGAFQYYDGIMHDTRLVLENIRAARQEGALCLNYAKLENYNHKKNNSVSFAWRDLITNQHFEQEAGLIVNCAGPWVPYVGRITPSELSERLCYSQGTHLLFNKPWNGPALILPLGPKGRYYFVWPHYVGTMVGTTERLVKEPSFSPTPKRDEIEEILNNLEQDLPAHGLNKSSLVYAFSGIRTLPLRGKGQDPSQLSRKHIWHYSSGMLSLLGGKFTTAGWTVFEGLKQVFKLSGVAFNAVPLTGRLLPGAFEYHDICNKFQATCEKKSLPAQLTNSCIRRLGSSVRYLEEIDPDFNKINNEILLSDLKFALEVDQAETIDDIFSRRLDLEYVEGHGLAGLQEAVNFLNIERPGINWQEYAGQYQAKINAIKEILKD
jgi:glycerol-3-phosphate dehydrogenase